MKVAAKGICGCSKQWYWPRWPVPKMTCNMLKWIARRFWSEAPSMKSETAWNMEREEDAWEALTLAVERVAEALEHLVGEK